MAYYQVTIGNRYYTGKEHMVVKVMANEFESDPDVYISRLNKYPTDTSTSEWSCEQKGSETCVIHNGEYAVGDTLYLGVRCMKSCSYKLRTYFTSVQNVLNEYRTQMRFEAYST